jgi:hypothetical protein
MGVAFRSSTTAVNQSPGNQSSSIVLNVPSGVQNGDCLIAVITWEGGSGTTVSPPAGWTLIGSRIDNGTILSHAAWQRNASSEPSSYTWNFGSSIANVGTMQAWTGCDPNVPVNANGGQANASSASVTAPSITTTTSGCQILFFGSIDSKSSWTDPGGFTNRNHIGSSAAQPVMTADDEAQATAGSTGTVTATASHAFQNIGQLIALAPPVGFLPNWVKRLNSWLRRKPVIYVITKIRPLPMAKAPPDPLPQPARIRVARQFYPIQKMARYVIQPPTSSVVIYRRFPRPYYQRYPTYRTEILPWQKPATILTTRTRTVVRQFYPIRSRGFFNLPAVTTYVLTPSRGRPIFSQRTVLIRQQAIRGLAGVFASPVVITAPPRQRSAPTRIGGIGRTRVLIPGATVTGPTTVHPPRLRIIKQITVIPRRAILIPQPRPPVVVIRSPRPMVYRVQAAGLRRPMWIPSMQVFYVKEPARPKHARVLVALVRPKVVPVLGRAIPVFQGRVRVYPRPVSYWRTRLLPGATQAQPIARIRQVPVRSYYPLRRPAVIVPQPQKIIVAVVPGKQRVGPWRPGQRRTLVIPGATVFQPVPIVVPARRIQVRVTYPVRRVISTWPQAAKSALVISQPPRQARGKDRVGGRRLIVISQQATATVIIPRQSKQVRLPAQRSRGLGVVIPSVTRQVPIALPGRRIFARSFYPVRRNISGLFSQTTQQVIVKSVKVVR